MINNSSSVCSTDYLNSKFFICLDSDLRHLLKQPGMSAADHIAPTYTYSWENHYCFAERLQKAFAKNVCPFRKDLIFGCS